MAGIPFGIGSPVGYPAQFGQWGVSSLPSVLQSIQTVPQQLSQLQQLEYVQQQQVQQLQQTVQVIAQQIQQLQQIVQFIPHQLQQLYQQVQAQSSPFGAGVSGVSGFGLPQPVAGMSGLVGSPAFYSQPGQVM
jgi:hypothetical protein